MNFIVGLDLSTKCTGYSVFASNGELIVKEKIKPKTTLSTYEKIHFIASEIYKMFIRFREKPNIQIDKVIIEDIYLGHFRGANQVRGFATLARLSGAVAILVAFAERKQIEDIITFRSAVTARPMVGLKGNCQKAEVQLWVLQNFTKEDTETYEGLIEAVQAKKIAKEITQKEYKARMLKISKLIENETEHGEDVCDAILLGYGEALKGMEDAKITTDNGIDTIDVTSNKELPKKG